MAARLCSCPWSLPSRAHRGARPSLWKCPLIGFVSWTLRTPTFLSGGNAFIGNVIISWPHAPCDIGSGPHCGRCRGVLVQGVGPCDPVAPGNWGHAMPGDPLASRLVQVDGKASLSLQPGSLWAKVPAGPSWVGDLDARVNTLLCRIFQKNPCVSLVHCDETPLIIPSQCCAAKNMVADKWRLLRSFVYREKLKHSMSSAHSSLMPS